MLHSHTILGSVRIAKLCCHGDRPSFAVRLNFEFYVLELQRISSIRLTAHSSQVFTVDQNAGKLLKCILTKLEVSTSCRFQHIAV